MEIILPARADAQVAIGAREQILAAPAGKSILIDASEVTTFSTSMAMVLLAARDRPGGLVLRSPSDEVVEGFSTLGLFSEMMTMELVG